MHRAGRKPGETNWRSEADWNVGRATAVNLGRNAENIVDGLRLSEQDSTPQVNAVKSKRGERSKLR